MANATVDIKINWIGKEGYVADLPVKAATQIFKGTLVAQATSGGGLVPYSTASSGHCVGVAAHGANNTAAAAADGDKRCKVETYRSFAFANGAGGDAFADTDAVGIPVYGTDDHTVAKTSSTGTRKPVGAFMGMESDGFVRVLIDPTLMRLYATLALLTDSPATADALRDNLVAGVAI